MEYELKSNIFDLTTKLHHFIFVRDKIQFKNYLKIIEQLNFEHYKLTGQYYVDKNRIIQYYEILWEVQWIKF